MKATGIVRRIDDLGRIVLPMELRKTFEISEGDPLEIYIDGETIILRKYKPGCCLCGSVENLKKIGNKSICRACAEKITAAALLIAEDDPHAE